MTIEPLCMTKRAQSILLVEDDAVLQKSLREFLRDCGFSTLTAGTRVEAWEVIQTLKPALCLLDLNLPDGSGLDLLRNIVSHRLPVRVIVMTAYPVQTSRTSLSASHFSCIAHQARRAAAPAGNRSPGNGSLRSAR